jgi:hypothetical protein
MSEQSNVLIGYYENGNKSFELQTLHGLPHGRLRRWHTNGSLEHEIIYNFGICIGPIRVWTKNGVFVGSFDIANSQYCNVSFRGSGALDFIIETSLTNFNGRMISLGSGKCYFSESFHISGRSVTKQQYIKACEFDLTLSPYEGDPNALSTSEIMEQQELVRWRERQEMLKASRAMQPPKLLFPNLLEDILADPSTREALSWLQEITAQERTLGKLYYNDLSILLVEEGYAAGCLHIYVTDFNGDDSSISADMLLIEIPESGPDRQRALEWVVVMSMKNSFPPDDVGQNWLSVQPAYPT